MNDFLEHEYFAGAGGLRLHVAHGGRRGRLMLFLHGFPEFWMAWHRQLAGFSIEHRVAAADLRGYNLSDKPHRVADYALPVLVEDVRRLLEALSPRERAILVGHDWGGIIAWAFAREYPEMLHRLVIINAPHPILFGRELRQSWRQRGASSYALFFQARGLAELTLRAFDCAALRTMVFGMTTRPEAFPPELRQAYIKAWKQPFALRSGLHYYRNTTTMRMMHEPSDLWRIHVPTLVLWGDQDPALRTANLDGLQSLVPNLHVHRHPYATHWIVHEEPDWVHAHMHDFATESIEARRASAPPHAG